MIRGISVGADESARAAGNAHRTHPGPRIRADAGITAEAIWNMVARMDTQNIRQNGPLG